MAIEGGAIEGGAEGGVFGGGGAADRWLIGRLLKEGE